MKDIIRKNFERASKTYHQYDKVQKKSAFCLANKIINTCYGFLYPNTFLDVGCGTGNLIKELYKNFPKATYHINDISSSMLEKAVKQFENKIDFEIIYGDIEQVNLENNYDIIISNMCLQWVDNLNLVIDKLLKHTKVLAFSCLLEDSFKDWYYLLEKYDIKHASRSYPSQKEIQNFIASLNKNILHESCDNFIISFCDAMGSMRYLRNVGANTPRSSNSDFKKVSSFLRTYNERCDLRYNIGFFIIEGRL